MSIYYKSVYIIQGNMSVIFALDFQISLGERRKKFDCYKIRVLKTSSIRKKN